MTRPLAGFALYPDPEFLSLTRPIIEDEAELYEVSPETLWTPSEDGELPLGPHGEVVLEIVRRSRKPCAGHGLGFSLGTPLDTPQERARAERWMRAIERDARAFGFLWYTEHLGFVSADGLHGILPLPIPHSDDAIEAVRARMDLLRRAVSVVGFENAAWYFSLDKPSSEPEFFAALAARAECYLLLDLHNAYTQCVNFDLDYGDYLGRMPLDRVIEIHISGGSMAEPSWGLGRPFRIDTHDAPVPEEVWAALERLAPRLPNLRAVVLERLDGTIAPGQVAALEDEFRRMRDFVRSLG
jgi:uncharacterized protein (UPF0276 family)